MKVAHLAKNTTYYTGALTVQKILSFIYFWFISNNLFPNQLGQYVFALSYATLFSILVDVGLTPVLTREASKDKAQANKILSNVLGLKLPLAVLAAVIIAITINISSKSPEVVLLVYTATAVMLLDSFAMTFWVVFRAHHVLKYESIATILVQIIIFSLGLYALHNGGEVLDLIYALLAASIFNTLFAGGLLRWKLKFSLRPKLDPTIYKMLFKIVPAFALAGVFVKIYNTSDSVLLSFLAGDAAVGFFAIPAKVTAAFQQVIPSAFAAVIFPMFSYYHANSKIELTKTFVRAYRYLIILSIPLSVGLIILTKLIITTLWPTYNAVVPTFIVMLAAMPFIFLAFPTGYLLNACDRQRNNTANRGIITVLAIVLNLLLIPHLSYFAAGVTFLITNVILLVLDFRVVNKILTLDWLVLGSIFIKTILATAAMSAVIIALEYVVPLYVIIPIAVVVYFGVLVLVKGLQVNDLKRLKTL